MWNVATFVATMGKTNPIGVRFDKDLLNTLKEEGLADTPQRALNYLTKSYLDRADFKKMVSENSISKMLDKYSNIDFTESRDQVGRIPDPPKPKKVKVTHGLEPKKTAKNTYTKTINTPPIPTILPGEDPFDFAARKNEWKKKYNQ